MPKAHVPSEQWKVENNLRPSKFLSWFSCLACVRLQGARGDVRVGAIASGAFCQFIVWRFFMGSVEGDHESAFWIKTCFVELSFWDLKSWMNSVSLDRSGPCFNMFSPSIPSLGCAQTALNTSGIGLDFYRNWNAQWFNAAHLDWLKSAVGSVAEHPILETEQKVPQWHLLFVGNLT